MRFYKPVFIAVLVSCGIVLVQNSSASIIYATSSSQQDVQSAVSIAATGDRIVIPSGNSTWTSTLAINKSIELVGPGSYAVDASHQDTGTWPLVITFSNGGNGIEVSSPSGDSVRITGISFRGTVTYGGTGGGAIVIEASNKAPWRIDNCYFNLAGNSIAFCAGGDGGLIDHIYTYDPSCTYNDCIQARDGRSDGLGNWAFSQPVGFGGSSFVFIEDSTFWKNVADGSATTTVTDSQTAGKFVFRHNYVKNAMMGWHGTESGVPERGGYAFEIYNNEFSWDRADWKYQCCVFDRGGSVLIYNNKATNYWNLWKTWVHRAEAPFGIFGQADGTQPWDGNWGGSYPPGYPVMDQQGRGRANGATLQTVQPQEALESYLWNNTLINTDPVVHTDPLYVVQGRDYEYSADSSAKPGWYTPFPYPHPMQSASSGTIPSPPTRLRLK